MDNHNKIIQIHDAGLCVYEIINTEEIVLREANEAYRKFNNLDMNCLHKNISEIFQTSQAKLIKTQILESVLTNKIIRYSKKNFSNNILLNVTLLPSVEKGKKLVHGIVNRLFSLTDLSDDHYNPHIAYEALFNQSPFSVMVMNVLPDYNLEIVTANKAYYKFANRKFGSLTGKSVKTITTKKEYEVFQKKVKLCMQKCITVDFVIKKVKNTRTGVFELTFIPVFMENSTWIYCYTKEITKQIEDHKKMRQLLLEYNSFFESSCNSIALIKINEDKTCSIERMNIAFEKLMSLFKKYNYNCPFTLNELIFDVVKYKKPVEDQICIEINGLNKMFYTYCMSPIISDGNVIKVFVSCFETTEKLKLSKRLEVVLTKRESEVLQYVANGNTNKYIAYTLGIAEGTVKKIIYNAYVKLDINSRSQLIKFYLSDNNTHKL